jgi:hypothetical protein
VRSDLTSGFSTTYYSKSSDVAARTNAKRVVPRRQEDGDLIGGLVGPRGGVEKAEREPDSLGYTGFFGKCVVCKEAKRCIVWMGGSGLEGLWMLKGVDSAL